MGETRSEAPHHPVESQAPEAGPADVLQIYQQYIASFGRGSFARDLSRFVGRIPAREGQSPQEAERERDSYWDRYAACLYDAGVREIQARFREARPIPRTPANQRELLDRWRQLFASEGAWSGRDYAILADWILERWDRIRGVEEVRRRGWLPPLAAQRIRAQLADAARRAGCADFRQPLTARGACRPVRTHGESERWSPGNPSAAPGTPARASFSARTRCTGRRRPRPIASSSCCWPTA